MSVASPSDLQNRMLYEHYLDAALGSRGVLTGAAPLGGGYRNTPWRLDVLCRGVAASFVLRSRPPRREARPDECYSVGIGLEYRTLQKLREIGLPVPRVWGLEEEGKSLGEPCFPMEFIEGDPLELPLSEGQAWAEEIYLDAVFALQAITREQLGSAGEELAEGCDALEHLDSTAARARKCTNDPLVARVESRLMNSRPRRIEPRFGNGDLHPVNMLIRGRALAGIIDFEFAGFSDPMFEFMSPFSYLPWLRNRRLEERYCERNGYGPVLIEWYRGLTLFNTWIEAEFPFEEPGTGRGAQYRRELDEWLERT